MKRSLLVALLVLATTSCQKKKQQDGDQPATATAGEHVDLPHAGKRRQYPPPPDVAGVPADAEKTASGVAYKRIGKTGTSNDRPGPNDTVQVQYTSWTTSGETYFSTRDHGKPMAMSLTNVGPGWAEALQMMTVGETRRLWLTGEQAFGVRAARGPRDLMVYEVELIAIERAPEVPADVAAPPADATRTASGLAYRVLTAGTGQEHPRSFDRVDVQFTTWTSDGRMVDSSVVRKRVRTGTLYKEMPGWVEGIQTMVVGEKKRFWIPEPLTRTFDWKPHGMLVSDIELIAVVAQHEPPPVPPDLAKPPASAEKTEHGVQLRFLAHGSGTTSPRAGDTVTLHFSGWTSDGVLFDSSVVDGQPRPFVIGRAMPGWTDVLTRMKAGDKVRAWIPEALAFRGRPGPKGDVVFDLELVDFKSAPKPPPAPDDVAAPPADAEQVGGVYFKVLQAGTGTVHPRPTDSVLANYTGWTTDGKMFDSSIPKGKPITFSLQRVIKGWTIGIPTMVVGEKKRFWIPKELAYDKVPGRPQGMLVFDVELVEIR